jgi:hypothetical protein
MYIIYIKIFIHNLRIQVKMMFIYTCKYFLYLFYYYYLFSIFFKLIHFLKRRNGLNYSKYLLIILIKLLYVIQDLIRISIH